MENAGFLFAAYTIIWAVVFIYLLILFKRQSRIKQEINALKEALKEKGN